MNPGEINGVMLQYFEWYQPPDGTWWNRLTEEAAALASAGFTALWLPPAYKGSAGGYDTGYGVYDHFDLGEFDQKGSVRTKYGTKDEYVRAIEAAQGAGLQVYADIVLSHKIGGDFEEEFEATPIDPEDRTKALGDPRPIKSWTHFEFAGRGEKYSTLEWHWWHFNALDHNGFEPDENVIWLIEGKRFQDDVDLDKGNADYLLGNNVDINSEDVRKELFHWGEWYVETTGVDGFRFDAAKHVRAGFFLDWLEHLREHTGKDLFALGEYWSYEQAALEHFIDRTDRKIRLYDTKLQDNFSRASKQGGDFDLRQVFDGTLVQADPQMAVTLVTSHDTQPLRTIDASIEAWFTPLAYALTLLRRDGYPLVFIGDYYGAEYTDVGHDGNEHHIVMPSHQWLIDRFLAARRDHAWGEQYDYFDEPTCIGWTRQGDDEHPGGLAVVISSGDDGVRRMQTGASNTRFRDTTEHVGDEVTTDDEGWAEFRCRAGSVSVWVPAADPQPS